MDAHPHFAAVDAGQTGIRIRLTTPDGTTLLEQPGVINHEPLAAQWADALVAATSEAGVDLPPVIAVGSSGLVNDTADDLLHLLGGRGVRKVALAHDSVTCYLGALGEGAGAVIAAGTGTICLAVGEREVARVDGWGHILGDAGSAYWIGRTAMEAAMRGYDGRRQMTALTAALAEEFPHIEGAYVELQADPARVARVARFARRVDELAASDRVAGNILDKAAAHLSEAVQAGLKRVQVTGPEIPRVAVLGGVFKSDRVLRKFTDYLTLQWPNFALTDAAGTALDGAERLLTLSPEHPLHQRVSVAGA